MTRFLLNIRRAVRSLYRGSMRYWFGRSSLRSVHGWRLTYRLRIELLLWGSDQLATFRPLRQARVWEDREVFRRIFTLVERAEHTVVIQMFIWRDDTIGRRMAAALIRAADRGVRVDITKEAVGDFFEMHEDFLATKDSDHGTWKRFWSHPHIYIHHSTDHDHAKVYIIDGRILLITGMNIADQYDGDLHDYMVEVRGQRFVERYLTDGELSDGNGRVHLVLNTAHRKEIRPALEHLIAHARFSIVVEHSLFGDPAIIDLLAKRSHEGVRITIIIPPRTELLHNFANKEAARSLMQKSNPRMLRVFLFPKVFHGKILLVDHAVAFLGSANLIPSSLDAMGEVNVLLSGATQSGVTKLRRILRRDILMSTPLDRLPSAGLFVRILAWMKL